MNRRFAPFFLMIAVAIVAAGTCCVIMFWVIKPQHHDAGHSDQTSAHSWIHTQLHLTDKQEKALIPIEQRYEEQKKHFSELMRIANADLAKILLEERVDSPRVDAAVARVHEAHGRLQKAVLAHVFEMQAVLTPEQYEKLLRFTAEALREAEPGR
jgi:nickel and cobalt resistance protein CnrR